MGLVFIMATLDTNMVPAGRDFKLPFICWVVLINHVTLLETFFVILYFHRVNRDQSPPNWLTRICPVRLTAKIIRPDLVTIPSAGNELNRNLNRNFTLSRFFTQSPIELSKNSALWKVLKDSDMRNTSIELENISNQIKWAKIEKKCEEIIFKSHLLGLKLKLWAGPRETWSI